MPVKQRRGKYKKLESKKGDKGDKDGPETRPKEDSIEVMNDETRSRIRSNDESDASKQPAKEVDNHESNNEGISGGGDNGGDSAGGSGGGKKRETGDDSERGHAGGNEGSGGGDSAGGSGGGKKRETGDDSERGKSKERENETGIRVSVKIPVLERGIVLPEEQMQVPDNGEWDYFNENDKDDMENLILAHCRIKMYLITTCQWRPYTNSWEEQKRKWVPFRCGQFVILCLIALSFVFDSGMICTVDTMLSFDWKFEITRIRNILWEARWLLGNLIGLWYFKTRHLEWFLVAVRMPERIWRGFFKRTKHFMCFLMLTCIGIPTGIRIYVINAYSKESPPFWKELAHIFGYAIRRYTTFPVFLALIAMLHLLDLFIKVSGEQVRYYLLHALRANEDKVEGGKEAIASAARKSSEIIGRMREVIFKTESKIKYFMLFHLVMLLLTAFLGIFSYMERLEFRINSTPTKDTGNSTREMNMITFTRAQDNKAALLEQGIREAIISLVETQNAEKFSSNNVARTSDVLERLKATLVNISQVSNSKEERVTIKQGGPKWQSIGVQLKEQISRTRLYIEIGLDCAETALLYGLPLFLLIKIDSSLAAIKERMIDLQAQQTILRFHMTEDVWKVVNFMKTVRGIRIFGFQSTLFRTLILTFAGPILLSVVHSLLTYVKMPK